MQYTLESLLYQVGNEKALLLYFFNDHCAPCLALRPKVEKLVQDEFPEMTVIMIDSEANPLISSRFSVFSSPTLLVFFEGKEHVRYNKFVSLAQLANSIERIYPLLFDKK
jgi:thioredoxin 1